MLEVEEKREREYRKGYIAGGTAYARDYYILITKYGLTDEEAREILFNYANTVLKQWAEDSKQGKKPFTRYPPELEIPEKYREKR